jgi:hypothetical protein
MYLPPDSKPFLVRCQYNHITTWELRFSGLLRSEYWSFLTDDSWPLRTGQIYCPDKTVSSYHYSLHDNLEEFVYFVAEDWNHTYYDIHPMDFYVLLTAHLGIILVNNQSDARFFFMNVYFYSLHVSGTHGPIIRRIKRINTFGICHSV